MGRKLKRYILSCCLSSLILSNGYGQRVSFDSSFGLNARTFTQMSNPQGFSSVYKFTTFAPDGSFYMAGDYNQPDTNYFVTKFKPGGSIDSSYGINGKLFTKRADFGLVAILATGMDSSFRFFLVGRIASPSGPPYYRLRVIRYSVLARVDSSFGTNGIVDIPFDNIQNSGINYPVAAYRDGRLLISSYHGESAVISNALIRLKLNGNFDSSFGTNGKLFLPPSSGLTNLYSLNIQADDKVVVARQFNASLFLFRYNANGTVDNGFNQTGMINVDYPVTNNGFQGIGLLSGNRILLSAGTGAGYYLYRFRSTGVRDSSFGGIGYVPYSYGFKTYARDFAEQPDGKILAAGVIQDNQQPIPNINSLITRTNTNGSIDSTFDDDGVWFFNYGGNPSSGMKHLKLLSTAKMLFSGLESGADWTQFVTYRLKEAYQLAAVSWGSLSSTLINYDCSSQVSVRWSTTGEANIAHFRVEYSRDNISYTSIAQITATGAPLVLTNYQYVHTTPQPGNNYYRIVAVAVNGQEFVNAFVSAAIPVNLPPLFEWLSYELVNRPGDDCSPAIKLLFRTTRPVIADSIIIEYSKDSLSFTPIAAIKVSVPQSQVNDYTYVHPNPVYGKNYYRLRTNGQVFYCSSTVYSVHLKSLNDIRVFPVPADTKLFFNQFLPPGSKLTVFDMKGSLVIRKDVVTAGNELAIGHLATGEYIIRVELFCTQKIIPFIKIAR